ncbi:probable cyclic nucleotide-gated ion channel 14 [Cicer arietinum]|uniref:probable cyclic nucleotide-gated ion channel 14 n=1 Tax=Cicer arietinum TaxID=3827 RepID=UPI003CC60139
MYRRVEELIVIWFIMPTIRSSHADHTNNALVLIVLLQYVLRLYMIFPLSSQIVKATGVVTKTAWVGAAYNLVLRASWYLLSIERHATCWKSECRNENLPVKCVLNYLDCSTLNDNDRMKWVNTTFVFSNCNPESSTSFNHGIFGIAVENKMIVLHFTLSYVLFSKLSFVEETIVDDEYATRDERQKGIWENIQT